MTVTLKQTINIGTAKIEKGTKGFAKGVSNSEAIKKQYPYAEKYEGWFYLVAFPSIKDYVLVQREQLNFSEEVNKSAT